MRTLHVEVAEEDIREGRRFDCLSCPIARAVQRAISRDWRERFDGVFEDFIRLGGQTLVLQPEVKRFIDRFDDGLPVEAFAFDLEIEAPHA